MKILFLSRSTLFSQPGGDTVQMEETARGLRDLGVYVDIKLKGDDIDFKQYQLVHFFNIGRPADLIPFLDRIKCPIVISTIWVQYHRMNRIGSALEYAKVVGRWAKGTDAYPGWKYLYFGQRRSISILAHRAKKLLCTTSSEAERIKANLQPKAEPLVIKPGLHDRFFEPFKEQPRSGVLVVARFEKLKNQLAVIEAANELNIPLTLIGNAAKNQQEYFEQCRALAKDHVTFLPYVPSAELINYYRQAEIVVVPSQFETFGLVALEAWSQGCKLILSNKMESAEHFEEKAHFFNPDSTRELIEKLKLALSSEQPNITPSELENWKWIKVAEEVKDIYENTI